MWIINEVYYAESIDVDFQDGGSVKAEVAAMPVIPGGLGAGVNASGDVSFILCTIGRDPSHSPRQQLKPVLCSGMAPINLAQQSFSAAC